MISLHTCPDAAHVAELKAQYLKDLLAPLDGMWSDGFIDPAPHREMRIEGERAGYYAANEEGTLLQFYVRSEFMDREQALFDHVAGQESLTKAVVSTIDPSFLSLCLDVQRGITVHTLLYELHTTVRPSHPEFDGLDLRLLEASELDRTVELQQACLASDDDMKGWLTGYSAKLISREELFVLCRGDDWIGLGESRNSDTQEGVTDLGMMVAPAHRGMGWATYILARVSADCTARGRRPICSTTVDNVASQKAITRAGFISRHRILDVAL